MSQAVPATSLQLSVVIPVYRAENSLNELYERLVKVCEDQRLSFEIIFVEDCGGDRSWEMIVKLAECDRRVRGVKLSKNYGQHTALVCGIHQAVGKVLITMDDDLEHPPEKIPKLLAALSNINSLVYAKPININRNGIWRETLSKAFQLFSKFLLGFPEQQDWAPFRAFYNQPGLLKDIPGHINNLDVYLAREFSAYTSIKISYEIRKYGNSGYTIGKLMKHALQTSISTSIRPIRIASTIGTITLLLGAVLMFWVIGSYLYFENTQSGFTFLASAIIIFSGVQLLSLGIIGEYIADIQRKVTFPTNYKMKEYMTAENLDWNKE